MSYSDWQVLASELAFPEGPAFCIDGDLWFVELAGATLSRWRPGEPLLRVPCSGAPNGLAAALGGHLWFCDSARNAIRLLDCSSGEFTTVATEYAGIPLTKPNDLAFDDAGNLIFTAPGDSRTMPAGSVHCLTSEGRMLLVKDGLYFPNGLAFSADGRTLVIAETYSHRLWRGAWDPRRCQWLEAKPWVKVGGPVGPDGMAFSEDGLLYVAIYGQGCVKALDHFGNIVRILKTPGSKPTNLAFDPSGKLGLVLTEAERGELLSDLSAGKGATLFLGGGIA